jgi:ATP-binding cassette subfamily B protein
VQETFAGIRVIKTYTREQNKMQEFEKESTIYRNTALDLVKVQAVFFPLILLLIGLSTVITIYIGGIEVAKGTVTAGNIAEFIIYVNQLIFPGHVFGLGYLIGTTCCSLTKTHQRISPY